MTRKLLAAMFVAGLGAMTAPQAVMAQADPVEAVTKAVSGDEESHVLQARAHAREALGAGTDGNADALVEHAVAALGHATAAQNDTPKGHVRAAIIQLNKAIAHGKKGHLKRARQHALFAVNHLEHARP